MLLPFLLITYLVELDVESVLNKVILTKNYPEIIKLRSLFDNN